MRQKYFLSDEAREMILREYDSHNSRELAGRLEVPAWRVRRWAAELGVARSKERPWSEQDLQYLRRHIGHTAWRTIAKHLGRTVTAVKLKAKRIGRTKMGQGSEGFTANQVAKRLGVDRHKVMSWIQQEKLIASRRRSLRTPQQGGDAYFIARAALRLFVQMYPEEIDLRRVDKFWFIELLAPRPGQESERAA